MRVLCTIILRLYVFVAGVLWGAARGGADRLRRDLHVGQGGLRPTWTREQGTDGLAQEDRGPGRHPLRAGVWRSLSK